MWAQLMTFDLWMLRSICTIRSPFLTVLFITITAFGSAPVATLLSLTIASAPRLRSDRRTYARLAVAALGGWTCTEIMKLCFERERPSIVEPLVDAYGFSFPSGHAVVASAAYLTLAIVICRQLDRQRDRILIILAAASLVLAIGLSRLYLGVHYPSDVIAGILFGILWALTVALLMRGRSRV